jgi:hypothetical protein
MFRHSLMLVKQIGHFVSVVFPRRLTCGLVFKSRHAHVYTFACSVLLRGENFLLVTLRLGLLDEILHNLKVAILRSDVECGIVGISPCVQIHASFFDDDFDAVKVTSPAQVVQHIPTLVIAVVEAGLLVTVGGYDLDLTLEEIV